MSSLYEEFIKEKMEKEFQKRFGQEFEKRIEKERLNIKIKFLFKFLESDIANNKSDELIKEVFDLTQEELNKIKEKL